MRGSPRVTALAREHGDASEEEGGHGPPSLRGSTSSGWLLVRRTQLQKSSGDEWSRISSANALPKERQGRVNRGLARSAGWRVTPSAGASSESVVAGRAHRLKTVRIGPRPRVAGDRHSAVAPSSKAVRSSRDRGCNDHRILRRVPDDGRHPGSFERVPFTRGAGGGLGGSSVFRPAPNLVNARTRGQNAAPAKAGEAGDARRIATGVSKARSHTAPWDDNAHAAAPEAESARVHSPVSCDDPPKRSQAS
jgi:hypothetical protein